MDHLFLRLIRQLKGVKMSSALIGYENVPNVYITDIFLENNNTVSYTVDLGLELLDKQGASAGTWYSNEDFRKYLKIGLIKTNSLTLGRQLSEGIINPHPLSIIKSSDFNNRSDIQIYPLIEFSKKLHTNQITFNKRIKFEVQNRTQSLSVFAFCYLDTQQIASDYKLDLAGALRNYTGALVGEAIIREGLPTERTNLFLKENNVVWSGPVHEHDGSYMEGSFHTSKSHGTLRKMLVNNYKLIDNRKPTFGLRKERQTKDDIYFSNLHCSINNQVDLWGIFSLNFKQIAIQKTKHGRKLHSLNNSFFQEYLSTVKINSLEITRQQIKHRLSYNSVGTNKISSIPIAEHEVIGISVDTAERTLKPQTDLREIYIDSNPLIRHFQFFDQKQSFASKGIFRYSAKITLIDNSQKFLDSKIRVLKDNLSSLKDFVLYYNSPSRYDYHENKLKPGVEMSNTILKILKDFYENKSLVENITTKEMKSLMNESVKKFLTANYRSITGTKLINEYESFVTNFLRQFNVTNEQKTGKDKPKTNKSATIPNFITLTKEFDPIVDFEEYRRFYDFLNIKKDIRSNITKQEFLNRGGMEIDRFFDTNKSTDFPEFKVVEKKTRKAVRSFKKSKNRFFSPLKFHFEKESVELKNLESINRPRLFEIFKRSNKRQETKRTFRNRITNRLKKDTKIKPSRHDRNKDKLILPLANQRKNQFKFELKKPDRTIKQIQKEYNIGSNIYLGDDSEFPFIEGSNAIRPISRFDLELNRSLEAALDLSFSRSKNKFDVSLPYNILDDYSKRKKNPVSFLESAPLSWKALILSRSPSAKNNILSEKTDVLRDSDSKVATEMVFQTTQVVEVLVGYKRDKYGMHMLSQPIWREFDEKYLRSNDATICRLRYLELPELGITPLEMFKMPIVNSTFIICERGLTNNITTDIFSPSAEITAGKINSKNEISKNIKYASSIVISQNIYKDVFRRSASAPMGEDQSTLVIPPDEIKQVSPPKQTNRRRTTSTSRRLIATDSPGTDGSGGSNDQGGY